MIQVRTGSIWIPRKLFRIAHQHLYEIFTATQRLPSIPIQDSTPVSYLRSETLQTSTGHKSAGTAFAEHEAKL